MNLLENPLFTGILPEELDQMKTCFEMENRTFREKEEIPMEGKVGILLSGSVSLNRLGADGNLDMLEYLTDGGIFGSFFSLFDGGEIIAICEKACSIVFIDLPHHQTMQPRLSSSQSGGRKPPFSYDGKSAAAQRKSGDSFPPFHPGKTPVLLPPAKHENGKRRNPHSLFFQRPCQLSLH